jgi:two-component system OmpR family sensor kinase
MRVLGSTIRGRLLLLYILIVAVVLASIGIFVYVKAQSLFINNRTSQAREAVYWAVTHTEPIGELQANNIEDVAERLLTSPSPDFSFFLFDSSGQFAQDLGQGEQGSTNAPLSSPSIASALKEGREAHFVISSEDRPHRTLVYIFPVFDSANTFQGAIQAEVRLDEADSALGKLKLALPLGLGGAFLAACIFWFLFTRAALRPVEEIGHISHAVASGDLTRRAAVPRGQNELRETALTFNRMLDSIQDYIAKEKQNQERMRQSLADLAHEFRSPLTVLRGYTDILLQGGKDDQPTLERSLEAMRSTLGRLTRVTNDLLTLSRLETGIGLNLEDINVNSLCQEILEIAKVIAEDKEIFFEPGPPVTIRGDTELLKRVLWNVLDNALRYTHPKGRITVIVTHSEGQCRVIIQDNGEGIAPEHLPHIFDRFYRVSPSYPEGTGLGLAIAKAIVEAHGGQIAIESAVGIGTTVTIVLPLST